MGFKPRPPYGDQNARKPSVEKHLSLESGTLDPSAILTMRVKFFWSLEIKACDVVLHQALLIVETGTVPSYLNVDARSNIFVSMISSQKDGKSKRQAAQQGGLNQQLCNQESQ